MLAFNPVCSVYPSGVALAATTVTQAYPILKLTDVGKSMTDDDGNIVTEGSVSTATDACDGTGSVSWEGQLGGWTFNSDGGQSGPDMDNSGIALDLVRIVTGKPAMMVNSLRKSSRW